MPSRSLQVINLLEWITYVRTSITTYGAQTREALSAELGKGFPSMAADDLARRYKDYDALLSRSAEALASAEDAYVGEQSDLSEARASHDASTQRLIEVYLGVSEVSALFPERTRRALDLIDPLPNAAAERRARIANVLELMGQGEASVQSKLGQPIELAPYRDMLHEAFSQNERDAAAMLGERREQESAMLARDAALERARADYTYVASMLSSDMKRAGLEEQARRVRPTVRRTQGIDARDGAPQEPPPETPAEA